MKVRGTSREHRGVSSWAIRRPVGTVMPTLVALVLGVFFAAGLPLDLLGLTVSMLLTLFVVPSAYLILHSLGDRLSSWLTGSAEAEAATIRTGETQSATP